MNDVPNTYVERHSVKCSIHKTSTYIAKYDAEACTECDRWLVPTCDDVGCPYCPKRPPLPSACAIVIECPICHRPDTECMTEGDAKCLLVALYDHHDAVCGDGGPKCDDEIAARVARFLGRK